MPLSFYAESGSGSVVLMGQVLQNVCVFAEIIRFFVLGNAAVFDGLGGAVADAGHAVGAGIAPDGLAVLQRDIVEGAQLDAFSTADALVGGVKIFGPQLQFAPDGIKGDSDQGLREVYVACSQLAADTDGVCHGIQHGVGTAEAGFDFFGLQHGISVVGHIVAGHFEFRVAPVMHALFAEHGFCQHTGDTAVAAAGKDKIHFFAAGERLLFQVFCHEPGHLADIDRGADDKGLFGMQDRMVAGFEAVQQIDTFIVQTCGDFFGDIGGRFDVDSEGGGIYPVAIDLEDPAAPKIDFLKVNMPEHRLCIVDTGGNHADLTGDYAAVPAEMKAIAAHFGKSCLREVSRAEVVEEIPTLRKRFGDRAILRALHFFAENVRVGEQTEALLEHDLARFFEGVKASGRSSFCYLQNVYTTKNVEEQGLSLALCLAEGFLADKFGAWRVHGGGFAGTIQCYVPAGSVEDFRALMDGAFGEGACIVLRIRAEGAMRVL